MNSGSLFQQNMDYVKTHSSSFSFKSLSSAPDETDKLSVEDAETGNPVFYANHKTEKVLLHSKRAPAEESARQLEQWEKNSPVDWNATVLVLGFAGMHHVTALYEKLGPCGTLIVVDAIPEVFKKSLKFCAISKLEQRPGNIVFIVGDTPEVLARELRHYLKQKISINVAIFSHAGVFRSFGGVYDAVYEKFITEIRTEVVDRGTAAEMSDEWIQNSMLNLPAVLRAGSISIFKNLFKGRTALMVAAGPSLNKALEYIKKAADKYVIFCVGTALVPLLRAGIEPDFVIVVDCDPIVMKQFSGEILPEKSILLASPVVFSELLNLFPAERLAFFDIGIPSGFNEWISRIDAGLEYLAVGGTVSLTAIDAAVYSGCENVIFCGLDLAFLDDGTTHASNSMYDGQKDGKENLVKVKGNFVPEVLTSKSFSTYISMIDAYLENTLNRTGVKFYNAATGGALLRNASVISPADMLEVDEQTSAANKNELISARLATLDNKLPEDKVLAFLDSTKAELAELRDTAEKAEKAAEIIFSNEENIKYSSLLSAELEKLDRKIREKANASPLASSALQPLFLNMFLSETDTLKSAGEKNRRFYEHLKGAADWLYGLVTIAAKAYKNKHNLKIGSIKL